MRTIFLILLCSSFGCANIEENGKPSLDWLVQVRSSGCEVEQYAVMWFALCGDIVKENKAEWLVGIAETVIAEDMALAELGLPPLSEHLRETLLRVYDGPSPGEQKVSGQYLGYNEPETKSISIWLTETRGLPHQSALAHEFMHLYDHQEFGVETIQEWYGITQRGRHFLIPIIAEYAIKHGRAGLSQKPNTALEAIVCGLDHKETITDGGSNHG